MKPTFCKLFLPYPAYQSIVWWNIVINNICQKPFRNAFLLSTVRIEVILSETSPSLSSLTLQREQNDNLFYDILQCVRMWKWLYKLYARNWPTRDGLSSAEGYGLGLVFLSSKSREIQRRIALKGFPMMRGPKAYLLVSFAKYQFLLNFSLKMS